jgi:uncharacterized membrane-anchored protein
MTLSTPTRLVHWRLWLPLLLQTAFIAAIPAQAIYTHMTGRTVILKTEPVDPYDLLRGYSQTLGYDISLTETLKQLPGGETLLKDSTAAASNPAKQDIYVILQQPTSAPAQAPTQPWMAVAVRPDRPSTLPPNQIALKGHIVNYGRTVAYGLERYYMPENRTAEVNQAVRQSQGNSRQPALMEIKVDANGNAVPVSIWTGDRNYRF